MTPEERTELIAELPNHPAYNALLEELAAEISSAEQELLNAPAQEETRRLYFWRTLKRLGNVLRERPQLARQTIRDEKLRMMQAGQIDPITHFMPELNEQMKRYYRSVGVEWPPLPATSVSGTTATGVDWQK